MWRNITRNAVLTLALAALLLPAAGCRRSRGGGSYTNVDVGLGFLPSFIGGGGFTETFVEESGYYDVGGFYDDGGYYDSGYYEESYYDEGYYWDDDWKAKNPGKSKR
ncbi:MAG: hypothetical protein AABZ08_09770 [Planctomycetota bacterium]